MAKICLVKPPFYKLYGVGKSHFPLGVGYIASVLEGAGHDVSFVDGDVLDYNLCKGLLSNSIVNGVLFYADPYFMERRFNAVSRIMQDESNPVWDILIERIVKTKPEIIGISCYTVNMTAVNIIANRIKSVLGDIPIILGGIHPTSNPQRTLDEIKSADYIVVGEGEKTFQELADAIGSKAIAPIRIDGVLARGNSYFKPRELIKDINSIPFPRRDFTDQSNYIFGAPILTSRGCMYQCAFCASHVMWTRKVRFRSVENVIGELKLLKDKFSTKRIRILDDTFVLNKKWIAQFCKRLKEEKLSFSFNCSGRINTVDEELFKMLSESGFDSIAFGVESGSPGVIERIKKNIDLSKVPEVIKMANRYGFDTTAFFMTGHPGETLEDMRMSEDLFRRSMAKRGELSMLIPYSQTAAGIEAERQGLRFGVKDYYKFQHSRNRIVFNITRLPDKELLDEHNRFERIVQSRNYYTLAKKIARLAVQFIKGKI